jgi:HPt (histidine-containing phosphotransfer) domain-containing protein
MNNQLPEGELYDLTMIRDISQGNNDFVKKMMSLFIETLPPAIHEIKQHLADKNWEGLGAVAHKIKPSIDTMGISSLKEDIRSVERFGKENVHLDELPGLIDKIDFIIGAVIAQLHIELNA